MRLSVETKAFHKKFGDKKGIEMIKEAGFDSLDFSFYGTDYDDPVVSEEYLSYAKEIRAVLDEVGIDCHQAHAPFDMKYGMEFDVSQPEYLVIVRSIEAAAVLGAKSIVVHAIKTNEAPADVDFTEYNYRYYKTFEPYCEKFGIKIAVENLFYRDKKRECFKGVLGNPAELSAFIEKLDSPWFTVCIDVGHASLVGYEPEDFIRGMKPGLVTALHIQDNDYLGDRHILPYTGKLNWYNIMHALKDIGYDGELNFELQTFMGKFPADFRLEVLKFEEKLGRYLIALADKE